MKQRASYNEIRNLEPQFLTIQWSIKAQGSTYFKYWYRFLMSHLSVLQAALGTCIRMIYNNVETFYKTVFNASVDIKKDDRLM